MSRDKGGRQYTNRPRIPRLFFRLNRYGLDLWWRYRPTCDGRIWTRAFGITIRPVRHKNYGEYSRSFIGVDVGSLYFGTRLHRKQGPARTPETTAENPNA